jgi:magnesium transporter
MINKYIYKDAVWVDLDNPSQDEIRKIAEEYKIEDPIVSHELISPSLKPKLELHNNYIYLITHFPVYKHTHSQESTMQEVDFIIGKDFVISTRYDTIDSIHKFSKIIEVDSILKKEISGNGVDFIFFGMLLEMYRGVYEELEYIEDWLGNIEKKIFADGEKEMIVALSKVSKVLLDFKKVIGPHKETLGEFKEIGKKIFGEKLPQYLKIINEEYDKISNSIENSTKMVAELRNTDNSMLSAKQNEAIKILTAAALVTFVITIITSLFQINITSGTIVGGKYDFWILIGVLVIVALGIWKIFKYKKWV